MKKVFLALGLTLLSLAASADLTSEIGAIHGTWRLDRFPSLRTKIQLFSANEIIVYSGGNQTKYYKYVPSFDGFCVIPHEVISKPDCNDAYKVSPRNPNHIVWFYYSQGNGLEAFSGERVPKDL